MVKISLGSDHAGYHLKEAVKEYLLTEGYKVKDVGAFSDESSDYPDFIIPAAELVSKGECDYGIVFGGSGNGETIAANKVKGIRCALCWDVKSASLAKEHNNANVISMGERMITTEMGIEIVKTWLAATFNGGRHERRIMKIAAYEMKN